jgi:NADPH:quinone reductase
MQMQSMIIKAHGGPEVLESQTVPIPQPSAGEVLVQHKAIGVNFVDTQHRAGLYYPVTLPLIPGTEAAGIVTVVGAGVTEFTIGNRVAYAGYMSGVYAEYAVVPVTQLVAVPENLDFTVAAGGLMQAMTAHALVYDIYPVKRGDCVLVHAAGSGVGLLLVQMAKRRGATVIGTVSSPEKARQAQAAGAKYVINYRETDFEAEVMRLTDGKGVQVIYDGVSGPDLPKGFNVLQPRGWLVVYGQSGGAAPPFDITRLSGIGGNGNNGSLIVTWATLSEYNRNRADLVRRAATVFDWLTKGTIKINIAATFPLGQAADAHRLLESRQVAGKLILLP